MSVATGAGEERIYGRFGRLGAAYDAARREFPRPTIDCVLRNLPGQDPFVLDLACGTGISTRQLAAGGIRVVGCDIDPLMLRFATERGGARIRYVIGRAEAVPFKSSSFDAVTSFCGYHWFDPARAMPEIARVLRPGGRIAITNIKSGDTLYEDFRKLVTRFVVGELPDHRKSYDPKRDLQAHGLRIVDEHSEREQQIATTAELCMQLQSVSVWNLIPDDHLPAARDELAEFCAARANDGMAARVVIFDTIIAAR